MKEIHKKNYYKRTFINDLWVFGNKNINIQTISLQTEDAVLQGVKTKNIV